MNQQALASKNSQEIPPDDHKRLEKAGDFSSQFQAPEFKAKICAGTERYNHLAVVRRQGRGVTGCG
jgi:hypothetical protein